MWVLTNTCGLFHLTQRHQWPVVCTFTPQTTTSQHKQLLQSHQLCHHETFIRDLSKQPNDECQSPLATIGVSDLYLACCSSRPADELQQPPELQSVPAETRSCCRSAGGLLHSLTGARGEAARGASAGTSAVAAWGHVFTRRTGIRFSSLCLLISLSVPTVKYSESRSSAIKLSS